MDPTWEHLAKNAVDAEKIEEAIQRIVEEHNEDSEAHLGEGQSLTSHRASEIIDHLAQSIVADKIKYWAEIKVRGTFERDDIHWFTVFESSDGYQKNPYGSGKAYCSNGIFRLSTGATNNSEARILKDLYGTFDFSWDKHRKARFTVVPQSVSDVISYIGTGSQPYVGDREFLGFKIVDNVLYGIVNDSNGENLLDLNVTLVSTAVKRLVYILTPGEKIEFFVNGVKKGEITENLPTGDGNWSSMACYAWINNTAASDKCLWLLDWDFWQEK